MICFMVGRIGDDNDDFVYINVLLIMIGFELNARDTLCQTKGSNSK